MKAFIYELGIIDKTGNAHIVKFKQGLNVITGKSSTGKSAIIEIFDYCFGSSEYTIPKGVITDCAELYYIYINIDEQFIVLGRPAEDKDKAFFKRENEYKSEIICRQYFDKNHFISLDRYKKQVRSLFLDIDDVDESLFAREQKRFHQKARTPSIRSFASFMLQHQNLVANKHALFYRFDEKEKRDQAIEHIKIFLGLVGQEFFHLSQEKERLEAEKKAIEREQDQIKKINERQRQQIEPVLRRLYGSMGFSDDPIPIQEFLRHPQDAKEKLDEVIRPGAIAPLSDAVVQSQLKLQGELSIKTSDLRKLQRKSGTISGYLKQEKKFSANSNVSAIQESVYIAKSVCPFCNTEHEQLQESAEQLQQAIDKLVNNLAHAKPMRAKFESLLLENNREIEDLKKQISFISSQLSEIDKSEKVLEKKNSLYESILIHKAKLDALLDSIMYSNNTDEDERLKNILIKLEDIKNRLSTYDYQTDLKKADLAVNQIMKGIGKHFDFEDGYQPINLHFSFETFDLYHLTPKNEKIFLRSMGSGANWLYSHVTLFLALHQYFASLGKKCSIPSILFFDQPTQVYFPSFKFDKSEKFDKNEIRKLEQRSKDEHQVDDDMKAVENLFSRLSIYCHNVEKELGFTPQIIVTDHADNLSLSNGVSFDELVNGNRWRTRGLIYPISGQM